MMKGIGTKAIKIGVMMVTAVLMLTGCRFGFASDPDDPNEVVQEAVSYIHLTLPTT